MPGQDNNLWVVNARAKNSTPIPIHITSKPPPPLIHIPSQSAPSSGFGPRVSNQSAIHHPSQISPRYIAQTQSLQIPSYNKKMFPPFISREDSETEEDSEEDAEDDAQDNHLAPPISSALVITSTPKTSRVGFATAIVSGISRPLKQKEIERLSDFEYHARNCDKCRDPCEQAAFNQGFCYLCDQGYDLALRVLRLGLRYKRDADQIVKLSKDTQEEQRVELSSREYENSYSLLLALPKKGKMQFLRPEGRLDQMPRGRLDRDAADGRSPRRKRRRSTQNEKPSKPVSLIVERLPSSSPRHSDASFGRRNSLYTIEYPDKGRNSRYHSHGRRRSTSARSRDSSYGIYEPSQTENTSHRRRRSSYHLQTDGLRSTSREREGKRFDEPSYYHHYGEAVPNLYSTQRPQRQRRGYDLVSGLNNLRIESPKGKLKKPSKGAKDVP
jgi:hypothetical protein